MGVLEDPRPPPVPEPEVARDIATRVPSRSGQALVLTGVRRSGKSVLQAQLMRRRRGACYCNIEDPRLYGFGPEDFAAFLSVLDELAPGRAPVFLDEVQEARDWQRLVRALLDRGRTVCVTGSNASLLGRELGTRLTGRHLTFEVFPFSYGEYLARVGSKAGAASLTAYLDDGGFPAYLRERSPQLLGELFRDIVQRDIAARHRLRETRHVMNLALYLMANTGQPLSLQTLTKSLAIPSVAQTSRYTEYLEDAYLLLALPKYSPSFKRRVVAPNKYYAVDPGLRRAVSPRAPLDAGHRLENVVYLALRRRRGPVFWAGEKDAWECDFVTDREAIQVCLRLTPENRARELRGLVQACRLPGRRRPFVLTLNQRDAIATDGLEIAVRPAWEWLLDEPVAA
jgi:predicted AAA+ superfamily ATPase